MPGDFRRRPGGGFRGGRIPGGPPPRPGLFPAGRRFGQNPLIAEAQRQLAEANRLMAQGKQLEAAIIFARIADLAAQNGAAIRAANLAARAAYGYLSGGDSENAQAQMQRAVRMALEVGALRPAIGLAHESLARLREAGLAAEAEALRQEVDEQISVFGILLAASGARKEATANQLPTQCPACLGPVRADEVEWIDGSSAECAYCGTVLRAE